MKRSPMPPRRTPLLPKRLNTAERIRRSKVREQVFARAGYRCELAGHGECFGPLTFHHRRKASAGGGYTVANGSSLCGSHNDRLEADADLAAFARSVGLVVRHGDDGFDLLGEAS